MWQYRDVTCLNKRYVNNLNNASLCDIWQHLTSDSSLLNYLYLAPFYYPRQLGSYTYGVYIISCCLPYSVYIISYCLPYGVYTISHWLPYGVYNISYWLPYGAHNISPLLTYGVNNISSSLPSVITFS